MPRSDARQTSLVDMLDASLAGPVVRAGVDPALAEKVLAAILDSLPPHVPTFVREIAGVQRDRASSLIADLIVFDGCRHRLRISEMHNDRSRMYGARRYTWLTSI